MRTVFADTFYYLAQFNAADSRHAEAAEFTSSFAGRMVTTDWVMVETTDAFSRPPNRARWMQVYRQLQGFTALSIIPAERALGRRF